MQYIFVLLSVCGLVRIISHGSILAPFRAFVKKNSKILEELIECPLCLGFWAGLAIGFCAIYFTDDKIYLLTGFAGSGAALMFDRIIQKLS